MLDMVDDVAIESDKPDIDMVLDMVDDEFNHHKSLSSQISLFMWAEYYLHCSTFQTRSILILAKISFRANIISF
jgi:hypothetical protein